MDKIFLKARAKINLSLDVLRKRSDGYHDVKMIMQTIDLHDSILIKKQQELGIKIKCNLSYVPTDNRNIVYKVTEKIINDYDIKEGVYINLRKNIPVSAGLGGGSTNGAAVLIGLNKLFDLSLSKEELMKIGAEFGADIPYCILGGTALAEGIGEKLTILPSLPEIIILICKPHAHISTEYVYKNLDLKKIISRPDTELLISAIKNKDIGKIAKNMVNVLESVTVEEKPEIRELKNILIKNGALGAMMSGTGTSMFGIFENRFQALKTSKQLRKFSKEIFITKTFSEKENLK